MSDQGPDPRYVSDTIAIPTPRDDVDFRRADLVFHGVRHSGPSYEARVFLNKPDADGATPLEPSSGYAGSFYIFGHARCFGDIGHCEIREEQTRDPFDLRLPPQLTPYSVPLIITEPLKRVRDTANGDLTVTVVPVVYSSPGPDEPDVLAKEGVLEFERLALVTYE
jgi:hypothetical protein